MRRLVTFVLLPLTPPLAAHGGYFDLAAKLKRYPTEGPRAFLDPAGYRQAIDEAEAAFHQRFAAQQAAATKP